MSEPLQVWCRNLKVCSLKICYFPYFGFRNIDGFGVFSGYQSLDLVWVLLVFGIFMGFDWILKW